jgi:DNA-binding IclR family transcriptional regulator
MIYRGLTLLEEEGMIVRAEAGNSYVIGPRVLTFSSSDDEEIDDVVAISRPFIEKLAALTGESVFLGIIVGRNRVIIDKIEGTGRRVAHSQRGLAVPLHVSKASRVLLAHLSEGEIEEYLRTAPPLAGFAHLFPASATETEEDVWSDIRRVRADGYIAWNTPEPYGTAYIAFPVLDGENRPQAVISIGAPEERMSEERREALRPQLTRIVGDLNRRTRLLPGLPALAPAQGAP